MDPGSGAGVTEYLVQRHAGLEPRLDSTQTGFHQCHALAHALDLVGVFLAAHLIESGREVGWLFFRGVGK